LPTAQKLMQRLAAHGLLTGTRGAGGGYALARDVTAISLADIVEAVEGPIAMTQCSGSNEPSDCALDAHCRIASELVFKAGELATFWLIQDSGCRSSI